MTRDRSQTSGHCANPEYCLWGIVEADCVFGRSQARFKERSIDVIDNVNGLSISTESEAVGNSFGSILLQN